MTDETPPATEVIDRESTAADNGSPEAHVEDRQAAAKRAEECNDALNVVLLKFRCHIVPYLNSQLEMIGAGHEPGRKGIVSCTYGVAPNL